MSIEQAPATDSAAARGRRRDRALKSSVVSGVGMRLLATGCTVATVSVSARALGTTRYGVLGTLATFVGLMAFADLGIGNGLMTRLAVAHGRDDVEDTRNMVSAALASMLGLGALVLVVGVVAALVLPWGSILGAEAAGVGEVKAAVVVFFCFAGLAIPAGIGQRIQVGLQQGLAANAWLLAAAAATLTGVAFAASQRLPLWCFIAATAGLPVAVAGLQSARVLFQSHAHLRPARNRITAESVRSLASISGLFLTLNVAVALAYQADVVIVASNLGAPSAAVYVVALRMFSAVSGLLSGASLQIWPSMAEALARGEVAWVRSRFLRMVLGTLAISVPSCILLVVLGRPVARLWVGPELVPSISLLVMFALWTAYSLAMTQVSYVLNAAQVVRPQVVLSLAMAFANVLLSLYLVRHIGIIAPLVGSVAAHVAISGLPSTVLAARILRRPSSEL